MKIPKFGKATVAACAVSCKVGLLISGLLVLGCAQRTEPPPPGSTSRTALAPALQLGPDQHTDLRFINNLFVAPPFWGASSAAGQALGDIELLQSLYAAAEEELTLHHTVGDEKVRVKARADALGAARKAGSDAVLLTTVTTYRERLGSDVAADEPARVGFAMEIVRVSDERSIWSSTYHYVDQAVTDNLFRAGEKIGTPGGLRWRTAKAIIEQGFRESLRAFSSARTAQFTVHADASAPR